MTSKLIALVDGSTYSKSVCEHAAWIAGRTGLSVDLMHVLGRREGGGEAGDFSGSIALGARTALLEELATLDEQRSKLAVHRGRAILDDAAALMAETGATMTTPHLRRGDLVDTISEVENDAELIMIGKRGEGADFAKEHLGSNLERVMRTCRKPLFIASRAFNPINRAVIAFDGSASSIRTVNHVAGSRLFDGLELRLVMAGKESAAARDALKDALALLHSAGKKAESLFLPGQPEEALAKLLEENPFDLLALGGAGHSRIRSLFVGSTTLEMIRLCKIPVLLVK